MNIGDNMLTALSVAHDCKMVSAQDKIVLVEAKLVQKAGGSVPQCRFVFEENPATARRHSTTSEKVMCLIVLCDLLCWSLVSFPQICYRQGHVMLLEIQFNILLHETFIH